MTVAVAVPRMREVMSANDLKSLRRGESVIYHVGPNLSHAPLAYIAREQYLLGRVILTQRRTDVPRSCGRVDWTFGVSRRGFEYIATGR